MKTKTTKGAKNANKNQKMKLRHHRLAKASQVHVRTRKTSPDGNRAKKIPERLAALREQILPVLLPYGVKRVALFGSVVRGEETPESDVDILVVFRKPIGLLRFVGLQRQLSEQLQRPVDLVSERALSKYIRPYVEKEKVVLYER